jgi:multidrug efflux system membrane fusion protein
MSGKENHAFKIKESYGELIDQMLKLNGITEASKIVELKAEVNGKIIEIIAHQGQSLKKAEPIIKIDEKNTKELVEEAKADLKQKNISYTSTFNLYKKGLSSESAYNNALSQLKDAESKHKSATITYQNTTIKAPFDGIVDTIYVEEGDYVNNIENKSLANYICVDPINVIVNIPEQDIALAKHATEANVILQTNNTIKGKISFLSKVSDATTRSFRMEVEITNPNAEILSGEAVNVTIPVGKYMAHKIPQSALSLDIDGKISVKTLDKDRIVRVKPIKIIDEASDGMWVSGLNQTEQIIVLGQAFINEGERVD